MKPHPLLLLALVGALVGFLFASVSTYDFAQHLDRQVHGVHCSFIPGLDEAESGGSDCEVTLMSPYSSVMRTDVWGGIPISLPAMGVFAFLFFFGFEVWFSKRQNDKRATAFYALGTLLPVGTSAVMAFISLGELDAACKLCIGIYVSSFFAFVGALGLWIRAFRTPIGSGPVVDLSAGVDEAGEWTMGDGDPSDAELEDPLDEPVFPGKSSGDGGPAPWGYLVGAFVVGVLFVVIPVVAYVNTAPDHSEFVGACGELDQMPESELLIPIGPQVGTPALEIFDPLCPACKGFEEHLEKTRFHDEIARKAVLFPLDSECNWMLSEPVHPGACTISEAVLCSSNPQKVIDWSFANQEKILAAAKSNSAAAEQMVTTQFPELSSCVGKPKVKQRLNRSLRWAVDAELKVLTPQLYVNGKRLCDEDVDLGLEFALSRMVEGR